jgi:outer membrane lipoprotein-sorting protein
MNSNKKPLSPQDPRLTAFALGELPKEEAAEIRSQIESDPTLREEVESIRHLAQRLTDALADEPIPAEAAVYCEPVKQSAKPRRRRKLIIAGLSVVVILAALLVTMNNWSVDYSRPLSSAAFAEEIEKFNEAPVRSFRKETTLTSYPDGKTTKISQVISSTQGVFRTEGTTYFGDNQYTIFDYKAGKRIVIYPDAKAAEIYPVAKYLPKKSIKIPSIDKRLIQDKKKRKPAHKTTGSEAIDKKLDQSRKNFSRDGREVREELLGKKEIDGQTAIGFKVFSVPKSGPITRWIEYWYGLETEKLILSKRVYESAYKIIIDKKGYGRTGYLSLDDYDEAKEGHCKTVSAITTSDYRTNFNVDPSFFSSEIPEGFTVFDRTKGAKPTFKQFCQMMKSVSKNENDIFPEITSANINRYSLSCSKGTAEDKRTTLGRLKISFSVYPFKFPKYLKPENVWHYVGGGVKLGTKDKAICWYKPDGAQGYTVLYADMSVKTDVKKEALPKIKIPDDPKSEITLTGFNISINVPASGKPVKESDKVSANSYRSERSIVNYPGGNATKNISVCSSAGGRSRTEWMNYFGEKKVKVTDVSVGKMVNFFPDAKAAEIIHIGKPSIDKKKVSKKIESKKHDTKVAESVTIEMKLNHQKKIFISDQNDVKEESLGKKEIKGKSVIGFKLSIVPKSGPVVRKRSYEYWYDVKTTDIALTKNATEDFYKNVIKNGSSDREVISFEEYDEGNDSHHRTVMTIVGSHFKRGLKVDPSYFNIEIPKGYTVIDRTVEIKPTFEQFCKMLKYAAGADGAPFPKKKLFSRYSTGGSSIKSGDYSNESATIRRLKSYTSVKPLEFYKFLKPENDWHYVGGGVKMGTKDEAICWYKPDGAAGYTVLYADMSVKKDVKKEALPKIKRDKATVFL